MWIINSWCRITRLWIFLIFWRFWIHFLALSLIKFNSKQSVFQVSFIYQSLVRNFQAFEANRFDTHVLLSDTHLFTETCFSCLFSRFVLSCVYSFKKWLQCFRKYKGVCLLTLKRKERVESVVQRFSLFHAAVTCKYFCHLEFPLFCTKKIP